jgi:hypothetical protein
MSGLLSRASCAATARQWGLQCYLQHSSSSSSGSSSSTRSSGMTNGQWSTDALAEMFEGVVGALLLDSDYSTVQKLLNPWVTDAFAAARSGSAAKVATAAAAVATAEDVKLSAVLGDCNSQQQQQQGTHGSSLICAASSSGCVQQEQLTLLLQEQLQQQCGYCFEDLELLKSCSSHVVQLLTCGGSSPQADTWHFLGFSLLQFAAAQHAYDEQCIQQQPSSSMWPQLPWQHQQQPAIAAAAAAASDWGSSSSGSETSRLLSTSSSISSREGSRCDGVTLSSSSSSSSSSGSINTVHLMSKQMVNLTTIRHRCGCLMMCWMLMLRVDSCGSGRTLAASELALSMGLELPCKTTVTVTIFI